MPIIPLNIKDIPQHWKIPLVGNNNKAIYICPNDDCYHYIETARECIGFSEIPDYLNDPYRIKTEMVCAALMECPKCFAKWWFHADEYMLESVLDYVKNGWNKHLIK